MTARAGRRRRLSHLSPRRWPVRSRIAGVSAALTFVILVAFALVVGRLVSDQLTGNFREELRTGADQVATSVRINRALDGQLDVRLEDSPSLREVATNDSAVRVVDEAGVPLPDTPAVPDFGAPVPREIASAGDYEVVSRPVLTTTIGVPVPVFAQYGRTTDSLDKTISRLWLFLGGGVLGGTFLAAIAGFAVASRAMRPIASLTATAREIATTRDPSKRIPKSESRDEVAELAQTLDDMLRELDTARSETEHMVQRQREFVADASHELRTPLTSILANLELLQESLAERDPDGEEADIVDGALRSSRRMRLLVSDLLLLARADAGRVGVRRDCDLAEIAASAHEEVRPFALDHRLQLDASGPVPIEGSPDELHRLVLNLLENAVRHTPPGTAVRAVVGRRDGRAVLDVSDDGPGLPEGIGDQVFARFFRGNGPADVAGDSGTGLGLAIVKAVAESHAGSVEAGRSPSGGARFTVFLPLAGNPAPRAAAQL